MPGRRPFFGTVRGPDGSGRPVRIGDFVFDPATGEVRRGDAGGEPATRLPPQPATLLELLIDKGGELATREELRQLLWPDTHVDFDQSLSFCIRQIRAAFGESASAPSYIETLPRRGYRLMRPVERCPSPSPGARHGGSRPAGLAAALRALRRRPVLTGLAAVGLVVALALVWRQGRPGPAADPLRLAVMPFELAAGDGPGSDSVADLAGVSEWLVAELVGRWGDRVEVIGPRSTVVYSALPFPDLRRLRAELAVDYVLNARLLAGDGEPRLLVELIRLDDGSHPWARYFADFGSWQAVAVEVRDDVARTLDLPPV